jgi:signal transduction histidine kinase
MGQLATNLLTLARLDAGRQHLEHEVLDLAELAAAVARRVSTLAAEKGLVVGVDDRPSRPALPRRSRMSGYRKRGRAGEDRPVLVGDRQAVEQAALILVENAIKYTPPGGTVTLRTAATDGQAHLIVEDTGVGIPPEHLRHLGERFYRVDPARSRAAGGAGLGLAIAFQIAAAHGGTLKITSAPGRGTRVTLSLAASGR